MRAIKLLFAGFFTAFVLSAGPVTLFSDFGPGGTWSPGPGWTFGCGAVCWGNAGLTLAFGFTPNVTANLAEVDTVVQSMFSVPETLLLSVAADSSGNPGAVLEQFSLPLTLTPAVLTAVSAVHPLLESGEQYWIVYQLPDPVNDAAAVSINDIGYSGPYASHFGNDPWSVYIDTAGVFSVTGDQPVPEPGSASLVIAGIFLAGFQLSRRVGKLFR
jgi:hypothetical protein